MARLRYQTIQIYLCWKNKNSKEASTKKEKGEKSVYTTTSFFERLAAVVNTCPKMKKLLNLGSKTASSTQNNKNFPSRGLKDPMPIDRHSYSKAFGDGPRNFESWSTRRRHMQKHYENREKLQHIRKTPTFTFAST
ncbi:hypothetical protein TNCV_1870891 [Trichonephila clavipes]|nr:hypothetical protein TNCV_1870891 [Trichonephila clavipes]